VIRFTELADRVYLLRYPVLDVNATLVLGDRAALLVDTLSTPAQAAELVEAIGAVTSYPLTIVNTHHHFDHCFGNAVLAAAGADAGAGGGMAVWAHEVAAEHLRERGARWQRAWYEQWLPTEPDLAKGLAEAAILPPNRTVHTEATLDVGGRPVRLRHFGRGHTDGDLVVLVPDVDVVLAGDLVEESGPPDFGDAYPLEWPETLAALTQQLTPATVVVPGHGAPVDRAFVDAQHARLTELDWLIRDGHADDVPERAVAARSPFGPGPSLVAVSRGYAELSGRI
jgi:glyoxylase-like metal-dependent hydrolase (beta-lactamase superfamily II)